METRRQRKKEIINPEILGIKTVRMVSSSVKRLPAVA
jgi:hypothetical protein